MGKERNFKIIFGGDGSTGKTSYLRRYTTGEFIEHSKLTIGTGFFSKKETFTNPITKEELDVNLSLWDFGGQERFRHILNEYTLGAAGGLVLFDLTRYETFAHIPEWAALLRISDEDPKAPLPLILIGNKSDLELEEVDDEDIEEMVEKVNAYTYIKTSCKTGDNIDLVMKEMVDAIIYDKEKRKKPA